MRPNDEFFEVSPSPQSKEDIEVNGAGTRCSYTSNNWRLPLLLWLHGVVDGRNVAAVCRNALYFGIDGLILSERET